MIPSLGSCPGKPMCDVGKLCIDHRDVLKAIKQAVAAEREMILSNLRRIADELWEAGMNGAATEMHGFCAAVTEGRVGSYSRA